MKPPVDPPSSYLARDYASFRELLLADLKARVPDTGDLPVASIEMTLVEAMAYLGDYLAYQQDAAASEAYVQTANHRASLARHSVLLGKRIDEGCCARTLVRFETHADEVRVPAQSQLLTRLAQTEQFGVSGDEVSEQPTGFLTLQPITIRAAHTALALAGGDEAPLAHARQAVIHDGKSAAGIARGDFAILHHSPSGFLHPVRLTRVHEMGSRVMVHWGVWDALPDAAGTLSDATQGWELWGNIALAQEGRWEEVRESLALDPVRRLAEVEAPPPGYAASIADPPGEIRSAANLLNPDPEYAEPQLKLVEKWDINGHEDPSATWHACRSLAEVDNDARVFVPEAFGRKRMVLRFSREPGAPSPDGVPLFARHLVGRGSRGNIAPRALKHMVDGDPRILDATNPLAATGGSDPEDHETARQRLLNDCTDRSKLRCVSKTDYEVLAAHFPGVAGVLVEIFRPSTVRKVAISVSLIEGVKPDGYADELATFVRARAPVSDIVSVTVVGEEADTA